MTVVSTSDAKPYVTGRFGRGAQASTRTGDGQERREQRHVADVAHVPRARCEYLIVAWRCELDGRIESVLKKLPCPNGRGDVAHTNRRYFDTFNARDAQRHLLPQEVVDVAARDNVEF
jgi:hypothetical protein